MANGLGQLLKQRSELEQDTEMTDFGQRITALSQAVGAQGDTPFTAVIRGLGTAFGQTFEAQGRKASKKSRQKQLSALNRQITLAEHAVQQDVFLKDLEVESKKQAFAQSTKQQLQAPINEAMQTFSLTGDIRQVQRLVENDAMKTVLQNQLPNGVAFKDVRKIGNDKFVIVGVDQAGNEVIGNPQSPLSFADADTQASILQQLGKQSALEEKPEGFLIETPQGTTQQFVTPSEARRIAEQQGGRVIGPAKTEVTRTGPSLEKGVVKDIQTRLLNTGRQLQGVTAIRDSFKPEFLTFGGRIQNFGRAFLEKAGQELSPENQTALKEFTNFRSKAFQELSLAIKELSGAAVSEQEAERLNAFLPNPDEDSPSQLKEKVDTLISQIQMSRARLNYAERNGLSLNPNDLQNQVSLEQMPQIMRQRTQEIVNELRAQQPAVTDQELNNQAAQRLSQEFGL